MAVRSSAPSTAQPQPQAQARTKESAIVTRTQLRRQRGAIERGAAWLVLVISFLGSISWLAGGWASLFDSFRALRPNWTFIIGGLAIQGVLTFLEWYYYDRPAVAWIARVIDAYTTARGYGPLALAWLAGILAARGVESAVWIAWAIIGVVSLGIAWYPESRLVD